MSKEELVETIHFGNLFVKEPLQTNKGLTLDHFTETKPNGNFIEPKLVQQGDKTY